MKVSAAAYDVSTLDWAVPFAWLVMIFLEMLETSISIYYVMLFFALSAVAFSISCLETSVS